MPEAGRVITGSAGGLRLTASGPGTRPVSDRVKQALFSLLESEHPDVWAGSVADLYAGSGALAIEALSRGAWRAVIVERDRRAVDAIVTNLERTGLAARARVVRADVTSFLAAPSDQVAEAPFRTVFADPPYALTADLAASLEHLAAPGAGWLDESALVVAKHFWRTSPPERVGDLMRVRSRRFGETALSVYRRAAEPAAGGS